MIWVWGVSLPIMFVNTEGIAPAQEARDWAGLGMFCLGFSIEVIADLQKDRFRADPANKGRACTVGVWSVSRHPNFFGEILLWWGYVQDTQYLGSMSPSLMRVSIRFVCSVWTSCTPVFAAVGVPSWGWATVLSPVLTAVILLLGSGMPTAEGDNQKRFMKTPQ